MCDNHNRTQPTETSSEQPNVPVADEDENDFKQMMSGLLANAPLPLQELERREEQIFRQRQRQQMHFMNGNSNNHNSNHNSNGNSNSNNWNLNYDLRNHREQPVIRHDVFPTSATDPNVMNMRCAGYHRGQKGRHLAVSVQFIANITLTSRQIFPTNTPLKKTWRLQNNGRVPWGRGVEFVRYKFREDLPMLGTMRLPIPNVQPGHLIDITVDVVTAPHAGRRCAFYRLRKGGVYFGKRCWLDIITK